MRRAFLLLVLIAACFLHAAFFLESPFQITPDTHEYAGVARNLLAGRGFTDAHGEAETMRTPGYPLFIAALGLNANAILVTQHLLVIGIALLSAWFLHAGGHRVEAFLSFVLIAFDTTLVSTSNLVMTEALFVFCLTGGLLAMLVAMRRHSIPWSVAAGSLIGFAPLVRPIAIAIAVPMTVIVLAFSRGRRVAMTAAFAVPALLAPSLWVARNAARAGVPTLSSLAGENMLHWRAAGALAMDDLPRFIAGLDEQAYQRAFHTRQRELVAMDGPAVPLSHARRAAAHGRMGRRIVEQHFGGFVRSAINGDLHLLLDPDRSIPALLAVPERDLLAALLVVARVTMIAGALAGIAILFRIDRAMSLTLAATIVYFLVLSAGPEANFLAIRFRAPLIPAESMCAAFALARVYERQLLRRKNATAASAAIATSDAASPR